MNDLDFSRDEKHSVARRSTGEQTPLVIQMIFQTISNIVSIVLSVIILALVGRAYIVWSISDAVGKAEEKMQQARAEQEKKKI